MNAMPFVPFAFQPPDLFTLLMGSQIGPFASPMLTWTNPALHATDIMTKWVTAAMTPGTYYLNVWTTLALAMLGMGTMAYSRHDERRESMGPVAGSSSRSSGQRKVVSAKVLANLRHTVNPKDV